MQTRSSQVYPIYTVGWEGNWCAPRAENPSTPALRASCLPSLRFHKDPTWGPDACHSRRHNSQHRAASVQWLHPLNLYKAYSLLKVSQGSFGQLQLENPRTSIIFPTIAFHVPGFLPHCFWKVLKASCFASCFFAFTPVSPPTCSHFPPPPPLLSTPIFPNSTPSLKVQSKCLLPTPTHEIFHYPPVSLSNFHSPLARFSW